MQPDILEGVIRQNVRHYRKLSGMTQGELATRSNTFQAHISNIERGTTSPSVALIAKLSEALGVEPYVLVAPPVRKLTTNSP